MQQSTKANYKNVGILLNPLSGRIKNALPRMREFAAKIPGGIYREASTQIEFEKALDEFAESRIEMLSIIGGDGTVHAVLSIIFGKKLMSPVPLLVIIPAGTTNMTSKDFNVLGKPDKLVSRFTDILSNNIPHAFITRPVLRVQNGEALPNYGMFFGTGLIADGVKYFQKRVRNIGITGEKASGIVIIRYLFYLLFGSKKSDSENTNILIQADDDTGKYEKSLLIFVTSLNRLLLGMRPYWGKQQNRMHTTFVRQSPRRLWRSIVPLISGRGTCLSPEDGYRSDNLSSLTLSMTGDYIIDGEVYTVDPKKGKLHISANDSISVMDLNI